MKILLISVAAIVAALVILFTVIGLPDPKKLARDAHDKANKEGKLW